MRVPDLVLDSELVAIITEEWTKHIVDEPGSIPSRRRAQLEQQWKRKRHLGRGAYGNVWLEECISGFRDVALRAVKQIRKTGEDSKQIVYHRELEAIMKFSNPRYSHCFVRSYGWYQCSDYVYITMEYLGLGDLSKHIKAPIQEVHASQITSQVLEGLSFMHKNGFSHRDLKPNNILVVSKAPDKWWVKISDFGISKREDEGLNMSSTLKGTLGFLAPELLFQNRQRTAIDDKAADMWALGETTVLILTRKPTFQPPGALFAYCTNQVGFPTQFLRSHQLSDEACDFIQGLMKVRPEERLTAKLGLEHAWMKIQYTPGLQPSTSERQL
ncbi:kinase-like protein [Cenococcum geophilum 1.58]|uniref:kinase-like protein n=1 Tax=Cenococcum geophilum 1.58 TaxID=794803 RepID=UPI00358EC42B|nr:kinase-like protein [Cenococcum geophilum 1.58]